MNHNPLTLGRAIARVRYDPLTGEFFHLISCGSVARGAKAGSIYTNGYWRIRIDGIDYLAHRVAWLIHYGVWPEKEIDHVNGIKTDNRISNLREATRSQNSANTCRKIGESGYKWVRLTRNRRRFYAGVLKDRKYIHLGTFDTAEAAYETVLQAVVDIHGEFARPS